MSTEEKSIIDRAYNVNFSNEIEQGDYILTYIGVCYVERVNYTQFQSLLLDVIILSDYIAGFEYGEHFSFSVNMLDPAYLVYANRSKTDDYEC